jgi:hypothetical protein
VSSPARTIPGDARIKLALLVFSLLALGCASDPHRYRYRPPIPVAEADWQVCHLRADREAQRRYDRYMEMVDLAGPFGGPFGGVTLGQRAWAEREEIYASAVADCLTEKGYAVRTRPGEPATPPSR